MSNLQQRIGGFSLLGSSRLMNDRQAAAYLGVSRSWFQHARLRGDGPPFIRIGGSVRYRPSDLDDYLAANTKRGGR